jgi:hypothetical protein
VTKGFNQPKLKEGGIPFNSNLGLKVMSTNCVTMQINPWGKDENPREPTMVVTTRSQLWGREGVLVATQSGHPLVPPIIPTLWHEDQNLGLEMMTFY